MTRFTSQLRADRGATDPVLTVGAITVTLIVSLSVIGALIWIIGLGTSFFGEQKTTTNLSQARDAFAKDAQNASGVVVDSGTQVTFYEPKTGSAVSTRGSTAKNSGCRVSQWTGVAAAANKDTGKNALTNVVWDTAKTDCSTDITKTAGTKVLSVDGFTTVPKITAANASGRALYTGGTKVTTMAAKTDTSLTNAEWTSTVVKNVQFTGTLTLDLEKSGRAASVAGTTRLGDDHALTTPGTIKEPDPAPVVWAAGAPTPLSASQTTATTAKLLKGYREGLDVSWGSAYCGPYIVQYNVTVTNPYVASKTYQVTDYAQTHKTTFTGIPNGSKGTVSVTATCPSGKKSAASSVPYTQKLGAPTLTYAASAGVDNTLLKWKTGDLSSAPVWYETQAKNSVRAAWFNGPDQRAASQYTWGWGGGTGQTYGTTNYRVLAHVDNPQIASNIGNVNVGLGAPGAPGIWNYDSGGAIYNNTIGWGSVGCPAGTHTEYNPIVSGAGQGWRRANSLRIGVRYSTTYSAKVQAHCVSNPYGVVGAASASGTTSWRTNNPPPPIPNAPSVGGTFSRAPTGGGASSVTVGFSANATQYEFGSILFLSTGGNSGYDSHFVSSSGTYPAHAWCGPAVTIVAASGHARAGGVSGWSGYNAVSLRQVGSVMGCS